MGDASQAEQQELQACINEKKVLFVQIVERSVNAHYANQYFWDRRKLTCENNEKNSSQEYMFSIFTFSFPFFFATVPGPLLKKAFFTLWLIYTSIVLLLLVMQKLVK